MDAESEKTKMNYKILKVNEDKIPNLVQLEYEADCEGYKFLGRAMYEFLSGENSFNGGGEILYGAYAGEWCLGICGLNIDPYTDERRVGRIRHLYVSAQFRGRGVARTLVEKVIKRADKTFSVLRLKSTPEAMGFYDHMGFKRFSGEHETHRMILRKVIDESITD